MSLPVPNDVKKRTRTFISYSVSVPGSLSLPFFLGPKNFDILRDVDPRLELVRAIDFGIFAWLVVPLLPALKWINGYVGNFGWSIIMLTGLLNIVMFPLRHRSMVSMKKMQVDAAGDEGDSGSVREVQSHRSRAAEDEHRR